MYSVQHFGPCGNLKCFINKDGLDWSGISKERKLKKIQMNRECEQKNSLKKQNTDKNKFTNVRKG